MTEDDDTVETVVYQGQQAAQQLREGFHRSSPVVFASTTRSSARRPVEIKATGGSGEGRKGLRERNRRFRSLGQHTNPHRRESPAHVGTLLAFKNFKYVWVGLAAGECTRELARHL